MELLKNAKIAGYYDWKEPPSLDIDEIRKEYGQLVKHMPLAYYLRGRCLYPVKYALVPVSKRATKLALGYSIPNIKRPFSHFKQGAEGFVAPDKLLTFWQYQAHLL